MPGWLLSGHEQVRTYLCSPQPMSLLYPKAMVCKRAQRGGVAMHSFSFSGTAQTRREGGDPFGDPMELSQRPYGGVMSNTFWRQRCPKWKEPWRKNWLWGSFLGCRGTDGFFLSRAGHCIRVRGFRPLHPLREEFGLSERQLREAAKTGELLGCLARLNS